MISLLVNFSYVSLSIATIENFKAPKDKLSKNKCKGLEELPFDTSIVNLLANTDKATVILNREDYLEKCMDHINNGPYQWLTYDFGIYVLPRSRNQVFFENAHQDILIAKNE